MVCWNRYIPSSLFYHYKRNQSVLKICQFYGLDYFGSDRGKVTKKQNGKSFFFFSASRDRFSRCGTRIEFMMASIRQLSPLGRNPALDGVQG